MKCDQLYKGEKSISWRLLPRATTIHTLYLNLTLARLFFPTNKNERVLCIREKGKELNPLHIVIPSLMRARGLKGSNGVQPNTATCGQVGEWQHCWSALFTPVPPSKRVKEKWVQFNLAGVLGLVLCSVSPPITGSNMEHDARPLVLLSKLESFLPVSRPSTCFWPSP